MRETILTQLSAIQREYGVRVLYACESGSRAWGFASTDSDYDVRFIYAHPRNSYLSILQPVDLLELPVSPTLDVNGWDIRKALQLFHRSNSLLYEWLQSPVVYKEEGGFAADVRGLMSRYFSHRSGCHHYLSMAYNALAHDLHAKQVHLRKYFYALRPTLACGWILEKGTVPPMEFGRLRTLIKDPSWNDAVDDLLQQKTQADEKAVIAPAILLQNWLSVTLPEYKERADAIIAVKYDTRPLDELFRKYIDQ